LPEENQMQVHGREANEFSGTARSIQQRGAWIVAVLICTLAASRAQTTAPRAENPKQSNQALAAGLRAFESSCASCHGLNGKGGERAPDIAAKPGIVRLSDNEILNVLRDGKPEAGMPPFGGLGAAKLSEILNYLRFLQGKRTAPAVAANAGNGKEFFTGKGGCSECHMVHGTGGFLGPDLSDYGASHSADDLRSAIVSADKRPEVRKGLAKAITKDGQQISGLVRNEDNFSVQLQALDGTFHLLDKSSLSELTFDSAPVMPSDYDSKLSKSELDQLVGYLLKVGDTRR
jgi:putative heme-binding domain-containing protein